MLLCFDLEDTLLDHRGAERAAALHFAEMFKHRVSATGEAFAALWRETTARHFQAFYEVSVPFRGSADAASVNLSARL